MVELHLSKGRLTNKRLDLMPHQNAGGDIFFVLFLQSPHQVDMKFNSHDGLIRFGQNLKS